MLTSLVAYARQRGLVTEPGFAAKAVRWGICFTPQGVFDRIVEFGDAGRPRNRGAIIPLCPDLTQPELKRAGVGWRHFLVDTLEVIALLADREIDDRLRVKHQFYLTLLMQASQRFEHFAPLVKGLNNPLTLSAIREALARLDAGPQDKATPGYAGATPRFPLHDSDWHDWWRARRLSLTRPAAGADGSGRAAPPRLMRCFASGALIEPAPAHPRVVGLSDVGGLSMGDSLAPFKQQAFCSYGLAQASNAAIAEDMAVTCRAALDDLIARAPKLAGLKVLHWFDRDVPKAFDPVHRLCAGSTDPASESATHAWAAGALTALLAGRRPDLRQARCFTAAVSGAAGRVMVRTWRQEAIEPLLSNVQVWFSDLDLIEPDGSRRLRSPAFGTLLAALAPPGRSEVAAPVAAALLDAAMDGRPLPRQVLALAWDDVRRAPSAMWHLTHYGMALLKAALNREALRDIPLEPGVNEDHPSVAYQCGRLTAILVWLQETAWGVWWPAAPPHAGADASARGASQRLALAAAQTPARALGTWLRRGRRQQVLLAVRAHPDGADRTADRIEARIASVAAKLPADLPARFSLDEQAAFALGYYQQRAADAHERALRRVRRDEARVARPRVPTGARG